MKKQLTLLFVLLLGLGSILAGCGGGTTEETVKQELRLNLGSEPPSLDSTQATDSVSFLILNNTMEGLYRLGPDNSPTPGIAESHTVSEDGTVYTFKLRDAKWSDGSAVTAQDFVYSWTKLVSPETASQYAYIMYPYIKGGEELQNADPEADNSALKEAFGVKALDDKTLEVTLVKPSPFFLGLTTFPSYLPQKESFVTEQGSAYALEADALLYNGPFKITSWVHETSLVIEKNADYWDAKTVKLEKISYVMVQDVTTSINLYNAGELDSTGLTAQYVNLYRGTPEFITDEDTAVFYLQFNHTLPVLGNVKFRQAVDKGFDKAGITNVILNNGSIPAYFFVPGNFVASPADGTDFRETNGNLGEYDAAAATALWNEVKTEEGIETYTSDMFCGESDTAKNICAFIKSELEKNLPGFTLNVVPIPFGTKLERLDAGDFQMSFDGWGPDYQDPMTFLDMWITDGPYNAGKYSNTAYDDLVKAANDELDLDARWDILLEIEKLLYEEQIIAPLYQRAGAGLRKQYIKGLAIHSFGADATYKWTYIEK